MPPWIYPDLFDESQLPLYAGFVYLITHLATGRMYVGKKFLTAKRGKKTVESDWRRYWSSSKELKAEFKANGHDGWERRIICFCLTKAATNYAEVEEQFARDVLKATLPDGSRAYFNKNIMARWFAAKDEVSEETKEKLRKLATGRKMSEEAKLRMSAAGKGRAKSEEHRAKIGQAHKGRVKTKAELDAASALFRSPEFIAKHTGAPKSEETKAKMRATWARKKAEREAMK